MTKLEHDKSRLEKEIDRAQDQQNTWERWFLLLYTVYLLVVPRTIVNRQCSELNRVTRELGLERDVLLDFQSKLDAAEYAVLPRWTVENSSACSRMDRTRSIIERARYNQEENALKEKEAQFKDGKHSLAQLRQRQEDWKVTQMKRAHLSALR